VFGSRSQTRISSPNDLRYDLCRCVYVHRAQRAMLYMGKFSQAISASPLIVPIRESRFTGDVRWYVNTIFLTRPKERSIPQQYPSFCLLAVRRTVDRKARIRR
jgi:hypothetical protein